MYFISVKPLSIDFVKFMLNHIVVQYVTLISSFVGDRMVIFKACMFTLFVGMSNTQGKLYLCNKHCIILPSAFEAYNA